MIDIEKYLLVKLPDVSVILSSAGFLRAYRTEDGQGQMVIFIYAPDSYDPEKMEFILEEADGFEKGFAIIPDRKKVSIVYLTSILNAYVSWAFITNGKVDNKTTLTIKKLSNIDVRILPDHMQKAVAYLHYLIMDIQSQKEGGSENPYLDYWNSVYKEVVNAIALELVMPQMFREYEIDMLGSWCGLIGKCSKENPGVSLAQLEGALGKELLTPQNAVVGNMKKLRVVMRTIVEHISDKV